VVSHWRHSDLAPSTHQSSIPVKCHPRDVYYFSGLCVSSTTTNGARQFAGVTPPRLLPIIEVGPPIRFHSNRQASNEDNHSRSRTRPNRTLAKRPRAAGSAISGTINLRTTSYLDVGDWGRSPSDGNCFFPTYPGWAAGLATKGPLIPFLPPRTGPGCPQPPPS
jgi:hypothetical protein